MQDYVSERLTVDQQYYDVSLDNTRGYSGLDEEIYPNEYIEDYYKKAEKHIADEKHDSIEKYNTDKYLSDLGREKSQYIDKLTASVKNIEVKLQFTLTLKLKKDKTSSKIWSKTILRTMPTHGKSLNRKEFQSGNGIST
ncbi:hypothetical protein [Vibrio splendidus]|uniref:hypothetical protein n=1 Tax=Vibrio splendidus TaxID=29497 RepID=UPI0039A555D9